VFPLCLLICCNVFVKLCGTHQNCSSRLLAAEDDDECVLNLSLVFLILCKGIIQNCRAFPIAVARSQHLVKLVLGFAAQFESRLIWYSSWSMSNAHTHTHIHTRTHTQEWVPGGELFHHLDLEGAFDEPTAMFFAASVLNALEVGVGV